MRHWLATITFFLTSAVSTLAPALVTGSHAFAASDDQERLWREDIAVYAAELEARHIDPFHSLPRETFYRELDTLREQLPDLSEPQIVAALMRLTHSIGDGHTSMPLWGAGYHRFPITLRWIQGQAIVTGTTPENAALLGARITHWDGEAMESVYQQLAPFVPFTENEHSQAVRVAMYLPVAELGVAIGITQNPDRVTVQFDRNGARESVELHTVDSETFRSSVTETITYRRNLESVPGLIETDGIRFALLADEELGYIRFDQYPSIDEMRTFAEAIATEMQRAGTRNLAIDFRENFGGNFFVGLALAEDLILLDQINWREGVYVLQGGVTFSAAMSNAAQFSDMLNARRVGEPSGANPCGYQDMGQFSLPNSGYLVSYSKRHYCFADATDGALAPDIHVAIRPEDFLANEDRALDWILQDIENRQAERN